jgi:hypothetical protein
MVRWFTYGIIFILACTRCVRCQDRHWCGYPWPSATGKSPARPPPLARSFPLLAPLPMPPPPVPTRPMGLTAPPPPPIVKEQRNSQIKKFLKNIGIRAASASGIRAATATGRMTVRAHLVVASILIPKIVQNGIRGCFISHTQKNSSKQFKTESGGCFISHPQKFSYIRWLHKWKIVS